MRIVSVIIMNLLPPILLGFATSLSVAADAAPPVPGGGLLHHVVYELLHLSVVEFVKTTLVYVLIPVLSLAICILLLRIESVRNRAKRFKATVEFAIIRRQFYQIYENGNRRRLNEQHIASALASATLSSPGEKLAAIQRLSQFSENSALDGLISLLYMETDETFKHIIIKALYRVVNNRLKGNE